jgi:hypothetical protein
MQLATRRMATAPQRVPKARHNGYADAAALFRREYTCAPCAAGDCLLCDGGACKCICSEDLDRIRIPARRGSQESRI